MRLLPRTLLGQTLLAAALALLAAQAVSGFLLFRAGEERREDRIAESLSLQMIAASLGQRRDERPPRIGRRMRMERSDTLPILPGDRMEPDLQRILASRLEEQGIASSSEVRVYSREALRDPRVLRRLARGRPFRAGAPLTGSDMVLASLPRSEGGWLTARAFRPPLPRAEMRAMVLQTGLLFVVLLLALWAILRRITRPLAALTARVDGFGTAQASTPPLEPQGPADVRRLIAAHRRMEARVDAMLEEKDVMLGAIGHDLKTPLAALRVRIESVADEAQRARMAAGIAEIARTLDEILLLARVGRSDAPPERVELGALAAAVVEEFEDMGQPVELADAGRLIAPVHLTWLKRGLRNLITNAVRYGGTARVSVLRDGDRAVLRVEDTGPGIPAQSIAAMVEPFARGEASRNRATGGAGLGLAIARAVAERHGGELMLANRAQGGLRAEIRVPG